MAIVSTTEMINRVSQSRHFLRDVEMGEFILSFAYLVVAFFSLESPGLMGTAYMLVGVVHVTQLRLEKAKKAKPSDNVHCACGQAD